MTMKITVDGDPGHYTVVLIHEGLLPIRLCVSPLGGVTWVCSSAQEPYRGEYPECVFETASEALSATADLMKQLEPVQPPTKEQTREDWALKRKPLLGE